MADLGTFLRREFARRGWSVRKAARETGIDRSTLGKLMRNPEQEPHPATLRQLADGLGMTIARLAVEAGYALGDNPEAEGMLAGLSDEQIAWWLSIPPPARADLMAALQRLYSAGGGGQGR